METLRTIPAVCISVHKFICQRVLPYSYAHFFSNVKEFFSQYAFLSIIIDTAVFRTYYYSRYLDKSHHSTAAVCVVRCCIL